MIVGFTITDFNGNEDAAVEFIRRVCILESPDIAQNIVDAGVGVNIFSMSLSPQELKVQPFENTPIETKEGKLLLASAVNFNLELHYNGDILRLVPTEYIYIEPNEVSQFSEYLDQGLVKIIREPDGGGDIEIDAWILAENIWNDNGIWVDSETWND